jgi:hypothetical protein
MLRRGGFISWKLILGCRYFSFSLSPIGQSTVRVEFPRYLVWVLVCSEDGVDVFCVGGTSDHRRNHKSRYCRVTNLRRIRRLS